MTQRLPDRRHPVVVSQGGLFATAARDFTPPPALDAGLIAGHPWGVRTILQPREQLQYMVYDRAGRNVLSCMPTPEMAAQWAVQRLEQEAIPPEKFSPRLAGLKFGSRSDPGSFILLHTVLDEDGRVVAESADGRAVAASLAVNAMVSRVDCLDATKEEFASTVIMARVTPGVGRSSLPLVFNNVGGDSRDQDQLARALRLIWRADERLQRLDESVIMPGDPDINRFVSRATSGLLCHAAKMGGSVREMELRFAQPERIMRFVFHDDRLGRKEILDHLYEDYLTASQVPQVESRPDAPRPRG